MILEKIFETKLTFKSVQDIYNPNLQTLCLSKLNKNYTGRCYKACLILQVNKIIQHSLRVLNDVPDGSVNISLMFAADCVMCLRGEILPKCKITQIESNNKIYAENEHCNILVDCNDEEIPAHKTAFYVPESTIPVICFSSRYIVNRDKISMIAYPFVRSKRTKEMLTQHMLLPPFDICFQIDMNKQPDNISLLTHTRNNLIDDIEKKKEIVKQLPRDAINYFKTLFVLDQGKIPTDAPGGDKHSPSQQSKNKKNVQTFDITDRDLPKKIQSGYLNKEFIDNDIFDETVAISSSDVSPPQHKRIIINDLESILIVLLNRYLHNYLTIIDLAKAYPTMQAIRSHDRLWKGFMN